MNRFELVRMILDHLGIDPIRFSVEWVSAAEGIRFAQVITEFDGKIKNLCDIN
jgi:F420-non-reducing hydrogenase iron-sulfur subunit